MKFLPAFILVAAVFTGCLKQDMSLCVADKPCENNLVLSFRYELSGHVNVFEKYINTVDVAIFDSDMNFVTYRRLEKPDLETVCGTGFKLAPGDYYLICGGNVSNRSEVNIQIDKTIKLDDARVHVVAPGSGSRLYYAPSREVTAYDGRAADFSANKITIPPQGRVEREMEFIRTYRRVRVYVQNSGGPAERANTEYEVTVTQLPEIYDFALRFYPSRRDYTQNTRKVTTPDGEMMMVEVSTPYYEITDEIEILFKNPTDGEQICAPINLKQYIEENPPPPPPPPVNEPSGLDMDHYPHDVDILVKFMLDGTVVIASPNWNESEVAPIW